MNLFSWNYLVCSVLPPSGPQVLQVARRGVPGERRGLQQEALRHGTRDGRERGRPPVDAGGVHRGAPARAAGSARGRAPLLRWGPRRFLVLAR